MISLFNPAFFAIIPSLFAYRFVSVEFIKLKQVVQNAHIQYFTAFLKKDFKP